MTASSLREAIHQLDSLPAIPQIAQRLLSVDTSTEAGQDQMLGLIGQDAQLLAKIIGLANSPMIGSGRKIGSISEAALILGFNRIKSIATGIAMLSMQSSNIRESGLNLQSLMMHNLGVSFAMSTITRMMPRQLRPREDLVFLAGMLHDIGYIALAHLVPSTSKELHARQAAHPERPILEIEQELLDISHDELGAELARRWNLPQEIISVIRYHHQPDHPSAPKNQPLVRMVYITEIMLPSFGLGEHVDVGISDADWEALGIPPASAEDILLHAAEQADQAAQFAANLG